MEVQIHQKKKKKKQIRKDMQKVLEDVQARRGGNHRIPASEIGNAVLLRLRYVEYFILCNNPKRKRKRKNQKYLSKTLIFFWGLGFGTYHVRLWNYAVNKNGDRNDPQTHNHCHSYFSHFSVSVSFTESLQLWDPCWAHPMTRGLSM